MATAQDAAELSVGSVGHSLFDFTFHSPSNDFLAFLLLVWLLLDSNMRFFIETFTVTLRSLLGGCSWFRAKED